MDNAKAGGPRATRARGKSTSSTGGETPGSVDAEMAPNLNGNKDGGDDGENAAPAPAEPEDVAEKDVEAAKDAPRPTRKRKLTDLEEGDSEEAATSQEVPEVDKVDAEKAVEEKANDLDVSAEEKSMDTSDPNTSTDEATSIANPSPLKPEPKPEKISDRLSAELKTLTPGSETYGKGKRARVPNKRYSDIVRTVTRTPKAETPSRKHAPPPGVKNGEFPDDDLGEILREESELEARATKKVKPVDISNPAYLKPFDYGWKRELVIRSTSTDGKRHGDVYYYNPSGRKLRSMRELTDHLKASKIYEVSGDNFTFFKEPLGVDDPDKEIIRDAKVSAPQMNRKIATAKLVSKPTKRSKTPVSGASSSPSKVSKQTKTSFKVKAPVKPTANKKEKKDGDVEPSSNAKPKGKAKKPPPPATAKAVARPLSARTKDTYEPSAGPPNFMNTYMQNLQYGYTTLFYVFQYLKVQDLLRAGCVCTMWRDMSRYPALWRTVRMKNSQIHSFEGMANALRQHGTVHLDLRKMLLPSNATNDDIWPSFTNAIKKVESLRRIELCRCLASVVEDLARNNHNLEVINAVTLKCESMTFEPFENLKNLVDLRLKSTASLTLSSDLSALKSLTKLKHLSITSIKDLNKLNIEVIGDLVNLEVLDLGECLDFPKHFGPDILSKLTKLEKLRLEKGQGECHTFEILEAVKGLQDLQQLELVNFDIKSGFDKSLGACSNIKKLLIIPTYISQSATTNHMVLGGVLRLQQTLSHFVWGVTLELLRVTELFVDQCEQPDKKEPREKGMSSGDSIPVLKPVPLQGIQQADTPPSTDTPQVEILPLPNLQKLLLQNLPTTRVKILKIPFHATWRQSITDSVN